eukprot:gnl/TRDRNA2_/TRDRNA2_40799_c0_seq1.p1 gnl/TRDRNA2_/TRDRNA2_40799_c0~~gnl/TRDRNA2_/TRDRNA2_40799_c0_seq1.p1  ORF type:complete len:333 (+),score=53.40 gnl/TRDRNA2_/TRDRNA2_40799_c0_seq1:77-1075(+)
MSEASLFLQASVLVAVVSFNTLRSLLTLAARGDAKTGFPFILETMLVFPFIAQTAYYFVLLAKFHNGSAATALKDLWRCTSHLGPCLLFSVMVAAGPMFETQSVGYLDASTVVVLKQSQILFSAFFEMAILGAVPSLTLWSILFLQVACVGGFNALEQGATGTGQTDNSGLPDGYLFGVALVFLSTFCVGLGGILQQRYLQRQAQSVPMPAKLIYQHVIGLLVISAKMLARPGAIQRLQTGGFFDGWNKWTYMCSLATWLFYLSSTAAVAYVSSMAGAVVGTIALVLTGIGEAMCFGKVFRNEQWGLMCCICILASCYGYFKRKASGKSHVQ